MAVKLFDSKGVCLDKQRMTGKDGLQPFIRETGS